MIVVLCSSSQCVLFRQSRARAYCWRMKNSQRCNEEDDNKAKLAHSRKLQFPDLRYGKRDNGGICKDVGYVGTYNKVRKIKALLSSYGLIPPSLHRLALENCDEDDGETPGHNKSDHAMADYAELAIDAKNAHVQAQDGTLDQGDIDSVVDFAQKCGLTDN